ncbi:MAG: hypothetical protein IJ859_05185 [Synergistaceae bacterium]|nr:hypothetical protein [Synergistaceae bacterium]
MRKIFAMIFLLLILSSASYGATSEDSSVYVRQDVFDAKMEAFMAEIRIGNERLQGELQVINAKLEALNKRLDDFQVSTSNRFDDLQASTAGRIDDVKTIVYWGLSILGLLIAFAIFGPSFGEFLRNLRTPSVTLEDVKRLIAEAKLSGIPQA